MYKLQQKVLILMLFIPVCFRANSSCTISIIDNKQAIKPITTLESVLTNYFVAVAGSKERILQITSLRLKEKITIPLISGFVTGHFESLYLKPDQYLLKIT
jgi:hypothetical protein